MVITLPNNDAFVYLLFVGHNVKHHVVHLVHTVTTQTSQIADGAVYIAFAKSVGGIHHTVVIRQFGTDEGAVQSCAHLQCATGLGSVAHHAGNRVYHILDGKTHLVETASMQVHNAACHTDAGVHQSAQGT